MSFLKKNCCDGIYNSSIDIRFTKLCDNACDFCIEDMQGVGSFGKTRVDRLVKSVRTAVEMDGKDTVLILGGEPFMFPKELHDFVCAIRPIVEKIYITTSLPKEILSFNSDVVHTLKLIDGLNISLHHYMFEVNNKVLKSKRPYDRVTAFLKMGNMWGDKIRIQTNLVKGVLDSAEEVMKMITLCKRANVKELKINELQDVGEDLYVSFDKLFPKARLGQPYSGGCVNDVSEFLGHADMNITVKRACFMVQEHSPHGASVLDLVKVVAKKFQRKKIQRSSVIYENGLRASGWIRKENLIHKEKA